MTPTRATSCFFISVGLFAGGLLGSYLGITFISSGAPSQRVSEEFIPGTNGLLEAGDFLFALAAKIIVGGSIGAFVGLMAAVLGLRYVRRRTH